MATPLRRAIVDIDDKQSACASASQKLLDFVNRMNNAAE